MSSIKFSHVTKEFEVEGSESFIESNLNQIQDLLVESCGVKKMLVPRRTQANRKPLSFEKANILQGVAEIQRKELSGECPPSPAAKPSIPQSQHELTVKRPPLRKYIRKAGMPGHQRIVVEVAEKKRGEISIAALKEKFGLSESKIGGIIRDAEKLGKIRRSLDGSYSLTQD